MTLPAALSHDAPAVPQGRHARDAARCAASRRPRKGQFFLLASILLAAAFLLGASFLPGSFRSPATDLPFLSENLKNELPAAYNLGLNQSSDVAALLNFSRFLNATLTDHGVNFTLLWVAARNASADANVTVGSLLGGNATVNLTIGSTTRSLQVAANGTNETLFTAPGAVFNLTIVAGDRSTTVEFLRNKASLYLFFRLQRGADRLQDELAV
ncbi:MAG: hypothetical protein HY520_01110 [Candidatus Aenigmarchaeota archaeon]|nr:hypothetical protein [Candidatus Aenigmarchaeota archaeon]